MPCFVYVSSKCSDRVNRCAGLSELLLAAIVMSTAIGPIK